MRLRYSPEALEDLKEIKEYISNNLQNPTAANKIILSITKSCSVLKGQNKLGALLSSKINRETDIRYIISKNYFVFYRIEEKYISVIRVIDGRTDYLRAIFDSI